MSISIIPQAAITLVFGKISNTAKAISQKPASKLTNTGNGM